MPSFVWKGKNRFGAFQEGILIADTRDAAVATLSRSLELVPDQPQVAEFLEEVKRSPH